MRKNFTRLLVVLLSLVATTLSAQQLTQLEEGAVYRFVNRGTGRALNAGETSEGALYVNATTVSTTDIKQQWYVTKDGDHYVLRNLYYAKYLKGAVTNKVAWSLTDYASETSNKFNLATSDASWNTLETKDWTNYGFMHDDSNGYNGGYRVVSWENEGANNSHWTVTKVEYDADELQTIFDEHPTVAEAVEKRTANFVSLFNEGACYTPKYQTLAEAQATTEYLALEDELQTLATNIYTKALAGDWAEANADDTKSNWEHKYAKKFRVQMYEPYSIAGDITSWLGINAHSNNDNPTGIYIAEAGTVYVLVEGTIKDGATLRLVRAGSNHRITNATGDGYALTTGLNIVNITEVTEGGDHLYICYNVDTYNPNGADDAAKFPHKLSDYEPLKIHIEGGYINGFYNAQGDFRASADDGSDDLWKVITGASVDCDDDWEYMEERANLSVIPVLGHRQILLFQLEDVDGNSGMKTLLPETVVLPNSTNGNKPYTRTENWDDLGLGISNDSPGDYLVNIMMESWDRIMYSELATMGLLSEADINKMNNLYPRWTNEGAAAEIYDLTNESTLDGKTYLEYCNGVDYSEYFNHHGVGLGTESGYMYGGWDHCGYHINTFGSIVSKLSSEAGPTWGPGHEIGHQHQSIFNLNGQMEVTNNMFANIAVWYMGMGTSRYNGSEGALSSVLNGFNVENNDAYTNNIWALTHMYYRLWLYYHLAGNNTQFMPRLFELCRRDRLENGTAISGDRSLLLFYKHACDAAGEDLTEFFRAHGYLEVMEDRLVGDYTSAIYTQTQEMVDEAVKYVKDKYTKQNLAIIFINDGTSETTLQHNGTDSRALWDGSATAELGSVNDFIDGDVSALNTVATMNSDGTITMSGDGGVGFLILNENGELVSFSNNSTFALSDEAKEAIISGNATFVVVDSESETTTAAADLSAMQKTILGELIAKAKPITEKIDDTYTKVGYYKAAAVTELAEVLEYAEEVYAGTSGYEEAYDLLYAEYKKVEANTDAKITLDLNKKYIINNKEYSTRNIAVDGTTVFALENSTGTAAQWSFVESSTAGSYYLKNADGYYCPAVVTGGTGGDATTDQSAAGTYKLIELEHGLWAIQGTNAPMHASSSQNYNIVGWTYTATASQWYITSTEADEAAASLSELQVSIAKTETLLNEVLGTVTYTRGENIALQTTTSTDAYYIWSNAPCATEGEIANLVDGVTNNYFHTEWNGVTVSSGEHYIAVDLGDGNTLPRFAFSHTTREADTDHAKSVDVYGSDDNVTYKYLGSASGMPQTSSTFWQFEGMMISSHRYLRFNVHANRGYWHMAEFDIMPVSSYTATVNDTYSSTVTVETVTAALEALYNGKGVVSSMSPQKTDVDNKLSALETAYEALYTQYTATIDARKEALAQLADNTQALIDKVGTIEIIATVEAKLQTTNSSGDFYVTTNAQSSQEGEIAYLVDGDNTTYFHTDYSGDDSSDGLDHYINIALGSNNATDKFEFSYVTRHNAETNYPTAMIVYGSTDGITYDKIEEITTGMPTSNTATYKSDVIECTKKFTHLRFMVTANNSGVEKGGHPFFHMAEFDLTTIGSTTINIYSSYNGLVEDNLLLTSYHTTNSSTAMSINDLVTSVPLLDAQIADQQAAYDKLKTAMDNATCDKSDLQTAYDAALELYNKMADGEGNVTTNYAPSTLTVEQLAAAKTALDAAKDILDNSNDQDEIDTAKNELDTAFAPLNEVEELNVAETKDKSALNTLIANTNTLLGTINGNTEDNSDYYASASLALDELNTALQDAEDAVSRYYLTEAQYTEAYEALNNCYTAANNIVTVDVAGRTALTDAIANVNGLLSTIAEECTPVNVAVPLQSTTADGDFYVSVAGTSSGSVANLFDKNADGTGITAGDSYYGSNWGSVAAYSQYVQVDLGEGITIDKLLFDYTTRDSGHSTERPTSIKVLGSNNGTDYTEITVITDDMPVGQCEQWSLAETLELGAPYRYVRFAVDSEAHSFHMSDFNLYAIIGHSLALKEYYTTAAGLEFEALCIALQSAQYAAGHYLTSEQLNAVVDMLNGYYTSANTIVTADVADRDGLDDLVTTTSDLVNEVATFNTNEEVLTMQCTDENEPYYLYCNADNSTNESAGSDDKQGVAALVGEHATDETFLHTTYGGNTQDDELDHYLRLDMGENKAMMSFKFRYTGRPNNNSNAPKTMVIEGSNDLNDFEEIATLTDLPTTDATVTYETPAALSNGKAYRYIRFMVTATKNGSSNSGHPFFALSQFAVTACTTIEVNEEYKSPNMSLLTLVTANNEVVDANTVSRSYVTQDGYTTALNELQAAYDALKAATVADKAALNELIEATEELKGQLYEITVTSYNTAEVTLQNTTEGAAGYIYCNAPGDSNNWGDNGGVSALIDKNDDGSNNTTTYLHTPYDTSLDDNEDDLDHYLRVDLGDGGAADYVQFRYTGRSGYPALTPKTAVIEATNDLAGEWTAITTLTELASTTSEVSTDCLGNGTAYRYWRFMVTETNDGRECNGHPYFALSSFNVYKCTDVVISEQLKYSPTIYIYTTTELVTEVEEAISSATAVSEDDDANQGTVDDEVVALQAVYDKLAEALKYAGVPVKYTTDEENPALYYIISKRADDGSKVLQYCEFDAANPRTVSVAAKTANSSYQAWYFMESENGFVIKPFNGDGKVLGADNTSDGHTKVWAVDEDEKSYDEWVFVLRADGYYNIKAHDGSNYFSNMNGESSKMGFWSGSPDSDSGSLFKFVDATFDNNNARFYQLSDVKPNLPVTTNMYEGTTVGTYTGGDNYVTAYNEATTLIEAGNTSATADCYAVYTALRSANDVLEYNLPVDGKIYRIDITPTLDDANRAGASMRIDDNGKLACGVFDAANAHFYFVFEYDAEGNLYMKNLHSATFVDEALAHESKTQVGADAEDIADAVSVNITTLGINDGDALVGITPAGGAMLNCAAKEGNVVAYNNTGTTKASAWVISEVEIQEVEENVVHTVTLGSNTTGNDQTTTYSSLCLGYPVTLPEGVTAYIVTAEPENEVVRLTSIGSSIPANTPVILSGTATNCTLSFTSEAVATVDNETNLLGGSNYTTYVSCLDENNNNIYNIYMLTRKNGLMAMRWIYENYDADRNYTGSNDDGGYVKCAANKAYLRLGGAAVQSLSTEYFFGFWGATTEIDGVEGEENPLDGTVYDLQGRKIDEVKVPGFYIVNGKKMYVDSEMLK